MWRDPTFDPNLRAFYYVRVIEIPKPRWPAYDANNRATMLINNEWKAVDDPHRDERQAMLKFEDLPMT